jgi:hypothetical protein
MKRTVSLLLFALCLLVAQTAFAGLGDRMADVVGRYGDYRMVIDERGRVWTKADWEATKNNETSRTFIHYYRAKDVRVQMDVTYIDGKGAPYVRVQRFTPDWSIQVKDLKAYFPEVYALVTAPEAKVFYTGDKVTKNFLDERSPLTLGVLVAKEPPGLKGKQTVVVFNIKGEGVLIKKPNQLTPDTYISEIVFELFDKDDRRADNWRFIDNIFK